MAGAYIMFTCVYCDKFIAPRLQILFKFVTNIEEERKVMNDERREHGTMDESLEQQICESDDHTLIVRKNWSPSTSRTGSYIS